MFDISKIRVSPRCPRLGNLSISIDGSLIEIVALDEQGNIKPDSYGSFQAASEADAIRRVELAWSMFQSFKAEGQHQVGAQEAFRALVGGYDLR